MTHAALFLPLILTLSSFLGFSTAQASAICPWTKVMPDNNLYYNFVRMDNGQSHPSTRLYHSFWSGSEQHLLLSCSWTEDVEVIRSYLSVCRQRPQDFSGPPKENLENLLLGADQCVPLTSGMLESRGRRDRRSVGGPGQEERSEVAKHPRVKRGFIVPGTLWCGSGNKAPSYTDLGVFSNTDSCCREHDQCKHTILSFQSGFGVFNSNIFTMSHCDCDKTFRSCLREANDRISEVVEYTFFNLLKMHCFTLSNRLQCAERNWFGMCKKSQMALYADVHPPELSEAPQPKACLNTSCININATIPAELLESSLTDPELHRMSTTASTPAAPASSGGSPSITAAAHRPDSTALVRPKGSAPEGKDELMVVPIKHQTDMSRYKNISEEQMSCGVYKDLDECRSKIPPQQRRHGLQNSEDRTLYHCNCTTRLFQTLAQQKQLTKVQTFLLGHVSLSCFLLPNCPTGNTSCTAMVVKAELPGLNQRPAEVEEQRHLQAVRLKVSKTNMRAKRKDRPVRLYKLCQRMTRTKHTQKVTTRG
ncbi:group 3 secretory phospholipase A2 isoform X1 [Nothobranchius furzeri]|uniref:phospholipase A2 n=1 Tax=Nothobranchius furzeri TaxID=105023 RepID=A0A1A7ZDK7_NOTFU|nr:transcript variant X1 [Nothobranchius furzeri]